MDLFIQSLPCLVKPGISFDGTRAIAVHEAAHVLSILRHNQFPESVQLDPPLVKFNHRRISPGFAIQLHCAGPIGQGIYTGRYGWSQGDIQNLRRVMIKHNILSIELEQIWRETHLELIDHWEWVMLIATKLEREKRLTKKQFKELIK